MIMQNFSKNIGNMMDCIRKAFLEGCQRGNEFQAMRYAITVEFKRLGFEASEIKDKLLEWNNRCEKVLGFSEQRTQLLNYVDWVFKLEEPKIGCRKMESCGFCLGKDTCNYYKSKYQRNRRLTKDFPFDWMMVKKFLEERFTTDAYALILVLDILMWYQQKNATGEIIIVSLRKIGSLIRDRSQHTFLPMEIKRMLQVLIDEGIIDIVIKGKSGQFKQQANGYKLLPWEWPQRG